jgi:hypothetical protein
VSKRALSLLLVLLAVPLAACATRPAARAPEQLVFWHIARADGAGGSAHLLGSMHVAREALPLDPAVEHALAEADEIALEVAPEELHSKELLELVFSLGQLPEHQSLAQLVGRRTLRRLERRVAPSGVPFATWLRWEPWLVTLMLANDQLATAGFRAEAGIEPLVGARAEAQRKRVRGLETAREQIERFDGLPLATQELLLRDALRGRTSRRSEDELESAWRRGDLEVLAREVFATPKGRDAAPFFESIYFARNRDFADDIARLVDAGGRWFVTLGAGHVVGKQGIPALLAARGYLVERVAKTMPPSSAPVAPAGAPSPATPSPQESQP